MKKICLTSVEMTGITSMKYGVVYSYVLGFNIFFEAETVLLIFQIQQVVWIFDKDRGQI